MAFGPKRYPFQDAKWHYRIPCTRLYPENHTLFSATYPYRQIREGAQYVTHTQKIYIDYESYLVITLVPLQFYGSYNIIRSSPTFTTFEAIIYEWLLVQKDTLFKTLNGIIVYPVQGSTLKTTPCSVPHTRIGKYGRGPSMSLIPTYSTG